MYSEGEPLPAHPVDARDALGVSKDQADVLGQSHKLLGVGN